MASNRIKGLKVEIDGDVTGLDKAFKSVDTSIAKTSKNLRDVERLLKMDPSNTELLQQKQRMLGDEVGHVTEKLKGLKEAEAQVQQQFERGDISKDQYDALKREISETEVKLKNLKNEQTNFKSSLSGVNTELKDTQTQLREVDRLLKIDPTNVDLLRQKEQLLGQEVDQTKNKLQMLKEKQKEVNMEFSKGNVGTDQYNALQREIIETEQKLKSLEVAARQSNARLAEISATSKKVATSAGNVANKMLPVTAGLAAAGVAAFKYSSDTNEAMNKAEVAFGSCSDKVKEFAEGTLDGYGIAKGTALDMASLFGDMATSMGKSQSEAANMSIELTGLAGDLSSFKNIGLDQSMTALNGIFTGETESLKRIGVVMTQTNLDAYALAKGFGKTTREMTESEKVSLRYQYVMEKTKNAHGDFARTGDQAANSARVAKESLKELASSFGDALLPVITPIIQAMTNIVKWFTNLDGTTKSVIVTILLLVAAIGPIAGLISGIATIVGALTSALAFFGGVAGIASAAGTAFGTVLAFLTSPITLVIGAIAGLIAIGVALYKNWDEITTFATTAWENLKTIISEKCSAIKEWVINKFNEVVSWLTNLPQTLQQIGSDMFNRMRDGVVSSISFVKTSIEDGINSAISFITSLPEKALIWGSDMIGGFVNGIKGAIGGIKDAVGNVVSTITSFLHFSRPDKGPLRYYEEWMPDFMGGLAKGINDNIGLIKNASARVSSTLSVETPQASQLSGGVAQNQLGSIESFKDSIVSAFKGLSNSDNAGNWVFPIYLGSKMVDEVIIDATLRNNVRTGGH